jgi:hypothetical protein
MTVVLRPRCLGSSTGSNQAILEDSIKWDISKGVAETVVGKNYRICKLYRVRIQTEGISDLKRESQFLCIKVPGVHMIDLQREICKPVLKVDFAAHGTYNGVSLGKAQNRACKRFRERVGLGLFRFI